MRETIRPGGTGRASRVPASSTRSPGIEAGVWQAMPRSNASVLSARNTLTLPRGNRGWHERGGLLAWGSRPPSRLPSGMVSGGCSAPHSGGAAPALHRLPSVRVVMSPANLGAAGEPRKSPPQCSLEPGPLGLIPGLLFGGEGPGGVEIPLIEPGNGVSQCDRVRRGRRWCGTAAEENPREDGKAERGGAPEQGENPPRRGAGRREGDLEAVGAIHPADPALE